MDEEEHGKRKETGNKLRGDKNRGREKGRDSRRGEKKGQKEAVRETVIYSVDREVTGHRIMPVTLTVVDLH